MSAGKAKGKYALGVDIGGSFIKSGLVDRKGTVVSKERTPIRKSSREELYEQLKELGEIWQGTGEEIVGIGIGVPGFINHKTGVLDESPNLVAVNGARIFEELGAILPLPAVIDNDANCAGWGEYWVGGGGEAELLILLTLGTGIGGGIVWNGEIWHGVAGYAGEIGHTVIVPDGQLCQCGMRGCIEAEFGAASFIRQVEEGIAAGRATGLADIDVPLKGKVIIEYARRGDELAREVVSKGCRYLGMVIANLINSFNPDQIVLGGGIIAAADFIMPKILEGVRERSVPGPLKNCEIRPSRLGNDAGLIGAAGLAWKRYENELIPQE